MVHCSYIFQSKLNIEVIIKFRHHGNFSFSVFVVVNCIAESVVTHRSTYLYDVYCFVTSEIKCVTVLCLVHHLYPCCKVNSLQQYSPDESHNSSYWQYYFTSALSKRPRQTDLMFRVTASPATSLGGNSQRRDIAQTTQIHLPWTTTTNHTPPTLWTIMTSRIHVRSLHMYITAMLSWDGHWCSSIVLWIPDLKNGHLLVFTGGPKNNIFATTPGDNPIEITRGDYSA